MTTLTADRARELLGGRSVNGHEFTGRDIIAGHANAGGVTLLTTPHRWQWRLHRERREVRPGARLIGTGGILLFLLGSGLLAVSYAAQYRYVLDERHQSVAALIEAGALDVGLVIFSLLALGLARAGLPAKVERALIVGCAAGSALMNYAAADVTSPRSVLAYCMPPVFLAFVVDRVVRTIQRHVLGMRDGRSPWAVLGIVALYALRFMLAAPSTCAGLRRAILAATPLPASAQPGREKPGQRTRAQIRHAAADFETRPEAQIRTRRADLNPDRAHGDTKTARFLRLVADRHGELSAIPLGQVAQIATAIAPEAGLHPASARTALLKAVRAALPAGGSDAR
jgi:hypothetical protein